MKWKNRNDKVVRRCSTGVIIINIGGSGCTLVTVRNPMLNLVNYMSNE
jgi:hypothetical protein